jgi:hypothetical protein
MSFRRRASAGLAARYPATEAPAFSTTAVYVFSASSSEDRGRAPLWSPVLALRPAQCVEILELSEGLLEFRQEGRSWTADVEDQVAIEEVFTDVTAAYIDISGFSHPTWAALVASSLRVCATVYAVYVEPDDYRRHPSPASRNLFDLSDGFGGVAPIPGFVKLRGPAIGQPTGLVALLGFEGTRARVVAQALETVSKVYPVVGVPGFRIEYPQYTATSNYEFINEQSTPHRIRYADAACPFECFDRIADIHKSQRDGYLYIAPVGTKPHALAAVLYALFNPTHTELIYDHPRRKPGRTRGVAHTHVYQIKPSYVSRPT